MSLLDVPGAIFINEELFTTFEDSYFFVSRDQTISNQNPTKNEIEYGLFSKTSLTYYSTWGTVQFRCQLSSQTTEVWSKIEFNKATFLLDGLYDEGFGFYYSNGSITRVFSRKNDVSNILEYPSNIISSCYIKTFKPNQNFLVISLELILEDGAIVDIIYNSKLYTFIYSMINDIDILSDFIIKIFFYIIFKILLANFIF